MQRQADVFDTGNGLLRSEVRKLGMLFTFEVFKAKHREYRTVKGVPKNAPSLKTLKRHARQLAVR